MVEITKSLKILLLINAIIGFCIAFFYIAIPHLYLSLIQWPFFDPYYSWAFGGVFLILSGFIIISLKQNQWERCKIVFEIFIVWQIFILVINNIALILIPAPIDFLISTLVYNITFIVLIIINIKFYTIKLSKEKNLDKV
ncbi:MAG: hypothetical protein ACFFDF_14080 [Candidatus Odinarchaeota archaeon]